MISSIASTGGPVRTLGGQLRANGGLLLLLAMLGTLPLESSKTLFPIQQLEISRIFAAAGVAWVLVRLVGGARPMPRSLASTVGILVAVVLGSWLLTRHPEGELLAVSVAAYAGAMVFVAEAVSSERAVILVMLTLFASGVGEALLALAQDVFAFYVWREGVLDVLGRANATFGDPNILARFLGLAALAGLALFSIRPWQRRRWDVATLAGLAAIGAALVVTQSRWGWLAFGLTLALAVVIFLRSPRQVLAVGVIAAGFVACLVLNANAEGRISDITSGVAGTIGQAPGGQTVGTLGGSSTTGYQPPRLVPGHSLILRLPIDGVRIYLIEAGVAMWQDHPLSGVGTGGFQPAILGPYFGFVPADRRATPVSLPHTSLIQVAAENGWIGVLAVLLAVVGVGAAVRHAIRGGGPIRIAAWSVAAGLGLIFAMSQAEGRLLSEPYLWLLLGLLAAIVRIAARREQQSTTVPGPPGS